MFIHLGEDNLIQVKDIISIINIEKEISEITKEFIKMADEEGFLQNSTQTNLKTLVIAEVNNKSKVFLSQISSSTLLKRTGYIESISNNK